MENKTIKKVTMKVNDCTGARNEYAIRWFTRNCNFRNKENRESYVFDKMEIKREREGWIYN